MGKIEDRFEALEKRVANIESKDKCNCRMGYTCDYHRAKEPPKHDVARECEHEVVVGSYEDPRCAACGKSMKPEQLSPSVGLPEFREDFSPINNAKQEPEDLIEKFDPQCFDAKLWADEFIRLNKSSDHGTMHAWFASAIMAGFDEARRREPEDSITISRKVAEEWVYSDNFKSSTHLHDELRRALKEGKG
jgi:hypothetical protein